MPAEAQYERGYVWPIYRATTSIARTRMVQPHAVDSTSPATTPKRLSHPTALIVFTSVRDGDMEIYSMKSDGSDVKRLTNRPGPNGGPFFSWDGKRLPFAASRFRQGPSSTAFARC